ncbi:MAG: helix-turn-helix transcriptional regulator [Bacilli bacterium]|nr:helix-turn-helix transcriptional regulator [Bacilli bacterium]
MRVITEEQAIERMKMTEEFEWQLIQDFIKLRKNHKLSQEKMAEQGGLIREQIAKIENYLVHPQVNTLIKALKPMGYTIKIVPIDEEDN